MAGVLPAWALNAESLGHDVATTGISGLVGTLAGPVSIAYDVAQVFSRLNDIRPSDFPHPWQRNPATAAVLATHPSLVVRGPAIGRQGLTALPGEPTHIIGSDLPKELRVTTPPPAPAVTVSEPVSVFGATTPAPQVPAPIPIVQGGSGDIAQLPGPISDTSAKGSTVSDLTNILGAGLDFLAGGTPSQILNALTGPATQTTAPPASLPTTSGPAITTSAGVTIPQTGNTTGLHRIPGTAYVNAQGQVVQVHLHKRRRRRRSLFTKAMAAEMELLFAVAGKGAIAKEIIATSRMR